MLTKNKMADAMANYPEGGIHEFTFMLLMAKTEKSKLKLGYLDIQLL